MSATTGARTSAPSAPRASGRPGRFRGIVGTGLVAVLAAVAATTLLGALARAAGVDLAVASEPIPLSGLAFVTGVFSSAGVVMAVALQRWSAHPSAWFVRTTVALTALSLVPPVLVAADAATTATLIGLHLVAAAVMIPRMARALRAPATRSRD
jgi:hypothetical protein